MPESDPKIREQIIRSIRRLTFWTAALFLSVAVVTILGLIDSAKQSQAIQKQADNLTVVAYNNRQALCTFRFDLQRRYDAGVQFLAENPDGIPGLTDEAIQRSLDGQAATLDSLNILDCTDIREIGSPVVDGGE